MHVAAWRCAIDRDATAAIDWLCEAFGWAGLKNTSRLLCDAGSGEGLLEESTPEIEPSLVDAVAYTLRDVPLDQEPCLGELLAGDHHGVDRNGLIHVAMHEKDRRA